jgi:hypothetical protein
MNYGLALSLRDAARELAECPEVAIIQHDSGELASLFVRDSPQILIFLVVVDVMQVAHHYYFENGITHFTRRINKCISMACANGEVAPFVGQSLPSLVCPSGRRL